MPFINSNSMGLPIPSVGLEAGPAYAFDVNTCLTLIDSHDHSPGKGVQITPAGLNINANLDMQGNSAINIINNVFTAQSGATNTLQALSVAPGTESPALQDLWYTDNAGNKVQLTSNGLVNATIASLPGESFAAGTFFWKQGTGSTVPANFDIGSITIRPNVALTTFGVTLAPSAGIASAYTLTLPLLPAVQALVSLDASGIMNTVTIDNVTLQLAGNVLSVKNGGISGAQIADGSITGIKFGVIWQIQDFTSAGSVTLPSNVQEVWIEGVGGGGGGGGGGRSTLPGGGGSGGGGGASSPTSRFYKAAAGEILTVAIGAGGSGGGISGNTGLNGSSGTASTVTSNINGVIFMSSLGDRGFGGNGTTPGSGGGGPSTTNVLELNRANGGAGTGASSGSGNSGGTSSVFFVGGSGGTNSTGGGAGGGGGSGMGQGGTGGNGADQSGNPATTGSAPAGTSYGSGGGGGGAGGSVSGSGNRPGGPGQSGFVRIMWLGAP